MQDSEPWRRETNEVSPVIAQLTAWKQLPSSRAGGRDLNLTRRGKRCRWTNGEREVERETDPVICRGMLSHI